jgi:hypothetical protein
VEENLIRMGDVKIVNPDMQDLANQKNNSYQGRYVFLINFAVLVAFYIGFFKYFFKNRYFLLIPDILFFLVFAWFLFPQKGMEKKYRNILLKYYIFAFIILSLLGIFNPNIPSLSVGLEGFRKTGLYLIAFIIGQNLNWREKHIKNFLFYLLIIGAPICLYSFKQYISPSDFDRAIVTQNAGDPSTSLIFNAYRATSLFSSPFILGFWGNIYAAISLYFFKQTGRKIYLISVAIGFGSVLCSITRVNLIAAFGVLLLSVYFYFMNRKNFFTATWVVLFISSIAFLVYQSLNLPDQYLSSLSLASLQSDSRLLSRFGYYQKAFTDLSQNWIVGFGTGSAGETLGQYFSRRYFVTPHNMFLKVFYELGVGGLLLFIWIWISWLVLNRRLAAKAPTPSTKRTYDLILIIVSILMVNGVTGGAIDSFPATMITYLTMGLVSKHIEDV